MDVDPRIVAQVDQRLAHATDVFANAVNEFRKVQALHGDMAALQHVGGILHRFLSKDSVLDLLMAAIVIAADRQGED